MIGDMFNNNKKKDVRTREDQIMYYGKKYRREKKTGYYVCTTGERKRLHDIMWVKENTCGMTEIPEGYVIHHIDWNKNHNEISNLTCVSIKGHNIIHNPGKNCEYEVGIIPGGISDITIKK